MCFKIECEYLFQQESKSRLHDFLRVLFFQLNEHNEAFIDLGLNNSYLAVKLYKSPVTPPEVADYEVPIFRKDRIDLSNLPWDISFQHLIPHIDGISHVKKIVFEVGMDIDNVKRSLKLLQFHGAILLSDVFKFTNIYKLKTDLAISLLSNSNLLNDMRVFSAFPGTNKLPTVKQVVAFLMQLQPNRTIQQILLDAFDTNPGEPTAATATAATQRKSSKANEESSPETKSVIGRRSEGESGWSITSQQAAPSATTSSSTSSTAGATQLDLENLDIARLLAFAQARGIIKRVHEYPLYVPAPLQRNFSANSTGLSRGSSGGSSTDTLSALHAWQHPSMVSLDSAPAAASYARAGASSSFYLNPHPHDLQQIVEHQAKESRERKNNSNNNNINNNINSNSSTSQRSGNVPMPRTTAASSGLSQVAGSQQVGSNYYYGGGETFTGTSVGLSGVLSAANSFNYSAGGALLSKEIGLRKTSFGPDSSSRRDHPLGVSGANASREQQQHQQQLQAQMTAGALAASNYNMDLHAQDPSSSGMHTSSSAAAPAESIGRARFASGSFDATHTYMDKDKERAGNITATTPGGYGKPALLRLSSRSKMTAGQNFHHNNHSHFHPHHPHHLHGTGHGGSACGLAHQPSGSGSHWGWGRLEVRDVLHRLNGKEHMDAICCRYDLSYEEIVNFPGVQLIFK